MADHRVVLPLTENERRAPLDTYGLKDVIVGAAKRLFGWAESHIPYELALRYQEPQIRKLVGENAEDWRNAPADPYFLGGAPIGFSVEAWENLIQSERIAESQLDAKNTTGELAAKVFRSYMHGLANDSNLEPKAKVTEGADGSLSFTYGFNHGAITSDNKVLVRGRIRDDAGVKDVVIEADAGDLYNGASGGLIHPEHILTHSHLWDVMGKVGRVHAPVPAPRTP